MNTQGRCWIKVDSFERAVASRRRTYVVNLHTGDFWTVYSITDALRPHEVFSIAEKQAIGVAPGMTYLGHLAHSGGRPETYVDHFYTTHQLLPFDASASGDASASASAKGTYAVIRKGQPRATCQSACEALALACNFNSPNSPNSSSPNSHER